MHVTRWEFCEVTSGREPTAIFMKPNYVDEVEIPTVPGLYYFMAELGSDGWELVSVTNFVESYVSFVYYFKRPAGEVLR